MTKQANARQLANAIERRHTELCRQLVRNEGLREPDRISARALRQAVAEHAAALARFPGLAETYARDIDLAEQRARALGEVQERARAHDRIIEGWANEARDREPRDPS